MTRKSSELSGETERLTIRVSKEIYENIEDIKEKEDKYKSEIVREALREYFKDGKLKKNKVKPQENMEKWTKKF